jgi:ribosomal protein S12 methylthiotransferase
MSQKISFVTLGCSKNLVDSEKIIASLDNSYEYCDDPIDAQILVINTCGFIDNSKKENVQAIIEAVELKRQGYLKKVIVMGCLSQRYGKELKEQIPGIDAIFGANDFENILRYLNKSEQKYSLTGDRKLLTPSYSAYLKIAEGCGHKCSFCSIPIIRGPHQSFESEKLIDEAKMLVERGVKEINIIAQDSTYYGMDLYGEKRIADLLAKISDINGLEWIRVLYAYPTGFPMDLIDLMAERANICNYIDIPLQHISDRILKSMKRGMNSDGIKELLSTMRSKVPDIAIRTSFIVGYPGETSGEFHELKCFIEEYRFDRVGVFTYSKEEDTSAFELTDNIKKKMKEKRFEEIMELQHSISLNKNAQKINNELKVLIEDGDAEYYFGRTQYDAPEVDNRVLIKKEQESNIGEFYNCKIIEADAYDLYAKIV